MNELLNVTINESNEPVMSARQLHEFLEIETPYRLWFPRMTEYGFEESRDYTPYNFVHPQNHQETTDHIIKLDMAKEIAMIQRSDKGKQARQYFLQIEKEWNSPEKVMARALLMADKKVRLLESQIEADKPKVVFADAVSAAHTSILIGDLAKLIKQNGVEIGQKRLFTWMRENGYLIKRMGADYNMPMQRYMEMGLFEIKETAITHGDGHISVSKTVKVTGKGQQYFINKFLS
jgi:anti-repressor protein